MTAAGSHRSLLIITHETIGPRLAGPGVRAWEIANALAARGFQVTLATPSAGLDGVPDLAIRQFAWDKPASLRALIDAAEVVLAQGPVLARVLREIKMPIRAQVIVDGYDISEIEMVMLRNATLSDRADPTPEMLDDMRLYLLQGDTFLCASARQRDLWTGLLLSAGRLNSQTLERDPGLEHLLRIVPMGIPAREPAPAPPKMKGVIPGISATDTVLFWGGGIWDWTDPGTLLDALEIVLGERNDVKLVFASLHHFEVGNIPIMTAARQVLARVEASPALKASVFFCDWVPYQDRDAYLLEADIGVSLSIDSIENRFAVRARLLDYLWAGLPSVVTSGDDYAQLLQNAGLAEVVRPGDAAETAQAILRQLARPTQPRPPAPGSHAKLRWSELVAPIADVLSGTHLTADAPAARARLAEMLRAPHVAAPSETQFERTLLEKRIAASEQCAKVREAELLAALQDLREDADARLAALGRDQQALELRLTGAESQLAAGMNRETALAEQLAAEKTALAGALEDGQIKRQMFISARDELDVFKQSRLARIAFRLRATRAPRPKAAPSLSGSPGVADRMWRLLAPLAPAGTRLGSGLERALGFLDLFARQGLRPLTRKLQLTSQRDAANRLTPSAALSAGITTPVPNPLPVGKGLGLLIGGWCARPLAKVAGASIVLDGHEVCDAHISIRPDLFPLPFLWGIDHEQRRASIGFWAVVPFGATAAETESRLALRLILADQSVVESPLGNIRLAPSMPANDAPAPSAIRPPRPAEPLIAICMTTFNPDKQLFERQVASLQAQTHQNWICVVSDDCSKPESYENIAATLRGDPRFVLTRNTQPLGFYHNFERCIAMAPEAAEFVALADHDDFWHRDKLETLLAAFNPDTTLVYSDMRIITPDQRVLANTYWTTRDNNHTNFASLLMANSITGAVSLFRRALLPDLLPFPQRIGDSFHDHWIGCVAMALGKVGYVPRPLHDYVQHRGQVIGHFVPSGSRLSRWLGALARINPRNARSLAQAYLNHGSLVYFNDAARIEAIARTLDLRCGYRLSDDRRKVIQRFEQILGGASWLWLTTRGMNPKRAAETVGAEHYLMRGFTWRAYAQLKPRLLRTPKPASGTLQQTAAPSAPARAIEFPQRAQVIREKISPIHLDIRASEPGRINLIIPGIDLKHLFGGYIGKLNLARRLAERGHRVRIVLVDYCDYLPSLWETQIRKYQGLEHLFERVEVANQFDRSIPLPVSPRDRFIATTWWTAHIAHDACRQLRSDRFLYLIQEYEPFTFELGSFYALAEQTYAFPHTALFSTQLLADYFRENRIGVFRGEIADGEHNSAAFQNAVTPIAPPTRDSLAARQTRRLLFYARPEQHAARNMFELGVLALARAIEDGVFGDEWEFHGIGTVGEANQVQLTRNRALSMLPRQTQDAYATMLSGYDIGLSLMYTPHPSLVPIEMASAGMSVVTNTFANKTAERLAEICTNFIAVEPAIDAIAHGLRKAVERTSDFLARTDGANVRWCQDWDCALSDALMAKVEDLLGRAPQG
ncbi:MAG TPA: glycosyltransferase [Thermoflexales bacterium]|mgnify:FL=1|nr:glycosyltransferase [Thermoflexales bacterium]